MKNQITSFIFALFLIANVSFSQNKNPKKAEELTIPVETIVKNEKIFLSSEMDWVTIISYRDWIEPVIENYAGKYEFLQPAQDEDGEFLMDAYNYITEIQFNSEEVRVLGYGSIEGHFEGIDTLPTQNIRGNKFGDNAMFVNMEIKTRNNEIKTVKGLWEFNENNTIGSFSELILEKENYDKSGGKQINVMSYENKISIDCIEDYIESKTYEYDGLYTFTHFGSDAYIFYSADNKTSIEKNFENLTYKEDSYFKNITFNGNWVSAVDNNGVKLNARFVKLSCNLNSNILSGFIGLLVNEENLYLLQRE